jgi:hypothetical protein
MLVADLAHGLHPDDCPPVTSAPTAEAGACARSAPHMRLLLNGLHGYCIQYPSDYDVAFINEFQVAFARAPSLQRGRIGRCVLFFLS